MTTRHALVVEDTPTNLDFLVRLLTQAGFQVTGVPNGAEAVKFVNAQERLDLAVLDMQLPDMNGLDLTRMIRAQSENTYIVVASMHDERSLMDKVFVRGGNCYLVKPHGFMELFKRLTTTSIAELCADNYLVVDHYGPRTYHLIAKDS